ncbi:alpha/beta fold hydrolase [Rhizobium sp. BK008]|uniref:alpha/beta fold hydrolase n=1 Tax=Rhizobium sp. BK008 TaxID=2587094 RepID=UPI001618D3E0|nr:alpha/beta hydrolase [Rhizobium sp. BK008]MBB4252098.1 pimeloyl-ACP methyl ester carboxylesterase [Rhizobium sp. BK008]
MTTELLMPRTASFVDIDGLKIRLVRSPSDTGLPVLITAPWPESIYAFNLVWPRICALGPVTTVDLPGFGMSESRPDLMSPETMGQFLIRTMDELGIERAHVVAPDVGTLAALFAASNNPERFESIVGGSGGISLELLGEPLRQIVESSRDDFAGSDGGEQVYQLAKTMARGPIPEVILEDYRASSKGQRWNEVADFVRAYRRDLPRLAELLPTIATPTLVVSGKDDPYVPPSNGQFLNHRMPHCRAEVIEAGHFVWEDAAETYGKLISEWITGSYRETSEPSHKQSNCSQAAAACQGRRQGH